MTFLGKRNHLLKFSRYLIRMIRCCTYPQSVHLDNILNTPVRNSEYRFSNMQIRLQLKRFGLLYSGIGHQRQHQNIALPQYILNLIRRITAPKINVRNRTTLDQLP